MALVAPAQVRKSAGPVSTTRLQPPRAFDRGRSGRIGGETARGLDLVSTCRHTGKMECHDTTDLGRVPCISESLTLPLAVV